MTTPLLFLAGLAATTAIPEATAGGNGPGNGGDAIVCPGSVTLLDYQEALRYGINPKNPLPGGSVREIIEHMLQNWEKVDERALKYRPILEEMISAEENRNGGQERVGAVYFTTDILTDIPDSNEVSIPQGCTKEQLVVQQRPVVTGDPTYTIRVDLWDKMSNYQKALTFTHEAFVKEGAFKGHPDTRMARRFNIAVAAKSNFDQVCSYMKFVREIDFRTTYYGGLELVASQCQSHPDGSLKTSALTTPDNALGKGKWAIFRLYGEVHFPPRSKEWTRSHLNVSNTSPLDIFNLEGAPIEYSAERHQFGYIVNLRSIADSQIERDNLGRLTFRATQLRLRRLRGCGRHQCPPQSGKLLKHLGEVTLRFDPKTQTLERL